VIGVSTVQSEDMIVDEDALDFAVVAWDESGTWHLTQLPTEHVVSLAGLMDAVRRRIGDSGAVGFVSIDEDFFIIIRAVGDHVRLMISDATAAHDWSIARELLEHVEVPLPIADPDAVALEDEEITPAGDMALLSDFGFSAQHLAELCSASDLYPDEMLATVARRLGFDEQFDALLELLP
jgi:putative tRNA adenosine deaminase-associated protein